MDHVHSDGAVERGASHGRLRMTTHKSTSLSGPIVVVYRETQLVSWERRCSNSTNMHFQSTPTMYTYTHISIGQCHPIESQSECERGKPLPPVIGTLSPVLSHKLTLALGTRPSAQFRGMRAHRSSHDLPNLSPSPSPAIHSFLRALAISI